jgi:hypothetical protein
MKIKDPIDILIEAIDNKLLEYGDYDRVKILENKLDDWAYAERKKCGNCQHERAGCQYHDG